MAAALTESGGGGGRPEAELWLARMRLLGRFELVARDGRPGTPRSVKGRAILAYLALAPAGTADRGRLAGLVWGESADAKASLRQCLRELRQTLAGAGLDPLLQTNSQEVVLDTRAVWIDALEVRRLLRAGGLDAAESIANLYAGDLLAEVAIREPTFEDWLTIEREALRARVCHALETRAGHCVDEGQLDLARRLAGALLAIDPAHEAAHRALMRVHALAGDLPAAMRQYQTCREALARGLDLRPSADTEKLLQAIRSGSLGRQDRVSRPPVPGGKAAARGPPAHLSVAVMERPTATADPTDRAVLSALGSGLREALARKRWLSIADPESIRLTGLGRSAVPRVAPDYQVSISILRIGDRLRFTAQLLEGHSARIVWADHYDRRLVDEVFELVDGLAGTLARRLDWEVELAETVRVSQQPPELLSARDQAMRAIPLIFDLTPGSFGTADRLLRAAQEAEPHDAFAWAWRAFWLSLAVGQGWAHDLAAAKEELRFLVRRTLELDPRNALVLAVAGHVASFIYHDYQRAHDLFEHSLALDPHSPFALDLSAVTLCYAGRPQEALRRVQPGEDSWRDHYRLYYFRTTACIALLLSGDAERAAEMGRRAVRDNPGFQAPYRPLLASLGFLGHTDEARQHLASLRQLNPDFSIDWFRAHYPPLPQDYSDHYVEGLRRAGVED